MQVNFTSWKEIAACFGRSVRTVQRWHVERDLPVRKLQIGKKAYIYADPAELQDWMERNGASLEDRPAEAIASPVGRSKAPRIDTLSGGSQWLTTPPEGAFGDVYPAVSADG